MSDTVFTIGKYDKKTVALNGSVLAFPGGAINNAGMKR